ncbi:MAG: hypothetical protein EXS05_14060 [Planctomycetaceae bacterium]|nr:hypothetical protein [Planctomycetaceae bacterium]
MIIARNPWPYGTRLAKNNSPTAVIPVDCGPKKSDNSGMSTDTIPTAIDDMHAVTEAVLAGRPIDPEVARRVEERAEEFRQRMIREHGLQNIGVELIRQAREERH